MSNIAKTVISPSGEIVGEYGEGEDDQFSWDLHQLTMLVSTVHLPWYILDDDSHPYETMVFYAGNASLGTKAEYRDLFQRRYVTEETARVGHGIVVAGVQQWIREHGPLTIGQPLLLDIPGAEEVAPEADYETDYETA